MAGGQLIIRAFTKDDLTFQLTVRADPDGGTVIGISLLQR
jgi:hypothetical protein